MSTRCRSLLLVGVLSLSALAPRAAVAVAPDSIRVHCRVFRDLDSSGTYSAGEPLLPGVHVTNGHDVFTTDSQGQADLAVDRAQYRFAVLTIPAGYWPTTAWFRWVPPGTSGPDTVDFGLRDCPESAPGVESFQWAHISDTHVQTWGGPYRFDLDLQEINRLAPRPLFIVNTGDLVDLGRDSTCWNHYDAMKQASALVVFPVPGNHDIIPTTRPLDYYERWVGPPYYSIEAGNWHLVIYCGDANNAASAVPMQDAWLAADLATVPPGSHVAMCQHYMLQESNAAKVAAWGSAGIEACFSGHWHSHQFAERPNGMRDFNISWIRQGGVDRTPRVFGIVTFQRDGSIRYDQRRLGVHHRAQITSPQGSQTVGSEALEILVQAYDTSSEVARLSATITAGGHSIASVPLAPEGISLWRTLIDASSLPPGNCSVAVSGAFADGTPIALSASCVLARVIPIVRAPNADWPMFRRCSAGSSYVGTALSPPLELAWATATPGMVALSSPVVAQGSVYLGCRAEHGPEEAGVLACNATNGTVKWFTHLPSGVALAPAAWNNLVIVSSLADSVYGLSASTGARVWAVPQISPRYTMTAPIFEADTAWVGTEPGVQKVRCSTGAIDWQSTPFGDPWYPVIYSAPSAGPSYLYYGVFGWAAASTGGFKVFERATGHLVHDEGGCFRSPLSTGGTVYVVGASDLTHQVLTARDPSGNVLWTAPKGLGAGTGSPALGHGVLVVAGASGAIEAFRASDGTNLWTKRVGPQLYDMEQGWGAVPSTPGTPAIADTVVYVGSLDGNLYALHLLTGAELWRWQLGVPIASSPAISGNMLFVAAEDEHLYAFNATSKRVSKAPRESTEPEFRLLTPHPNPTAAMTSLTWTMTGRARVSVQIYDVTGRLVRSLVDDVMEPGMHQTTWNGLDGSGAHVGSGVYWAQLRVGRRAAAQQVVFLRR